MTKAIAQVSINRGQGKKEHLQMFILGETTSGLYLTSKLDPNDFGVLKGEWFPLHSANIQCQILEPSLD